MESPRPSVVDRVIDEAVRRGQRRVRRRRLTFKGVVVFFVCGIVAGSAIVLSDAGQGVRQPAPTGRGTSGKHATGITQKPPATVTSIPATPQSPPLVNGRRPGVVLGKDARGSA